MVLARFCSRYAYVLAAASPCSSLKRVHVHWERRTDGQAASLTRTIPLTIQAIASMTNTNAAATKIGFSLTASNKKKQSKQVRDLKFGENDDDVRNVTRSQANGPLVIPLKRPGIMAVAADNAKIDNGKDNKQADVDTVALNALMEETSKRDSTKHAGQSSLIIEQRQLPSQPGGIKTVQQEDLEQLPMLLAAKRKIMANADKSNDVDEFQKDLQLRASDVPTDSDAYSNVPISEFGAAMLRGMGWKGDNVQNEDKDGDMMKARHHRLGLGATKQPNMISKSGGAKRARHWAQKPGSAAHRLQMEEAENEKAWKGKLAKKELKQSRIQVGSVVAVLDARAEFSTRSRRAILVKVAGVPGLNRVLIRYEGGKEDVSVRKGDIVLVEQDELDKRPFAEGAERKDEFSKVHDLERRGGSDDNLIKSASSRLDHKRNGHRRKRSRSRECNKERKQKRKKDKERRQRGHEHYSDVAPDNHSHWLLSQIRVRVISKKVCNGRQYKQKGIIMDVIRAGEGVLQMTDGEVVEVKESWIETALPKVGGKVVILQGPHRYKKGKLLERHSSSGKGFVQLYEDMNVLKLSLDDIAEWCGPLDEDLNE